MSGRNAKPAGQGSCAPERTELYGRAVERARLKRLLVEARTARGGGLVLRGAPGTGKTALLDHARAAATDSRIIRLSGVPSEAELPYSGLQLLCSSLVGGLSRLVPSQREALETAVGRRSGPPPDRFLVGVATLSLLSWAAEQQPLLCLVDDAQWLDRPSAQVLAFVARRLGGTPVALFFAEREPSASSELDGLPELLLGALPLTDARRLLGSVLATRVDESVLERILAETRGNPRALLECVRDVASADLAGGYGMPATRLLPDHTDGVRRRMDPLSSGSRLLLLAAAAEPLGDPTLLWRAAAHLGIACEAREQIEAEGMVSFGVRVLFDDPRSRHAVYSIASPQDRRNVHRALATATDPLSDPDRRAWHLAQATGAPDDTVGDELNRLAARAHERGGLAGQAAFLEQSALLTANAEVGVERALTAAAVSHEAGAQDAALRLLGLAELGPLDDTRRARLTALRARVSIVNGQGNRTVEPLLAAARQLETLEPELAGETYLEALGAAIAAGRLHHCGPSVAEVARTVRRTASRSADPLLEGLIARSTDGYAAAVEPLGLALASSCQENAPGGRAPLLICLVAPDLWDDRRWDAVTAVEVKSARCTGALTTLPYALTHRALFQVHTGDFDTAAALVDEAGVITAAAGPAPSRHVAAIVAAWRGEESRAVEVLDGVHEEADEHGDGIAVAAAHFAEALLYNGLCRYEEALVSARQACESDEPGLLGWSLLELVEAAVHCGESGIAEEAVERLVERTRLSGTDWALGVEARCRALLRRDRAAEELHLEAIERLGHCRITTQLARSQLMYGEWLRRQGRRMDARVPLREAQRSFTAMGAQAFAERARRELLATGEQARQRRVETRDELTPQESQIALLACDGLSNPEIGSRLSISPRTVEYHLRKVFGKLGITSRLEIHLALPDLPKSQRGPTD